MAPKGGTKQQSEEDLLLQDFSRNLSAKSSALFFGNAFIVSAIPICELRAGGGGDVAGAVAGGGGGRRPRGGGGRGRRPREVSRGVRLSRARGLARVLLPVHACGRLSVLTTVV